MLAKITVKMDNAAFHEEGQPSQATANAELAHILRDLAENLEAGNGPGDSVRLRDSNGNIVGSLEIEA